MMSKKLRDALEKAEEARGALQEIVEERRSEWEDRSERWQESERGEKHEEITSAIEEICSAIEVGQSDVEGLVG